MPVAELRYDGDGVWRLYFGDRNGKWTLYFDLEPKQPIDVIINELEEDPTCVFWGWFATRTLLSDRSCAPQINSSYGRCPRLTIVNAGGHFSHHSAGRHHLAEATA